MVTEPERQLISEFADSTGRVQRPTRLNRKLAKRWKSARLAQAKLDGDLMDNTLDEQIGYASSLASSLHETLIGGDFGLRGALILDPDDEDAIRPALLLATDKSVLITVITEKPVSANGVNLPREHYRIDFMADYPFRDDSRPFWGLPSHPNYVLLRVNDEQTVVFRSLEPDEETAEFLKRVEVEANRAREDSYLPPLSNLIRGPRPEKRLVRDAYEAEEMVALWVRWLGWPDAETTVVTGDGGIDVIGSGPGGRAVAQVKFEAKPTGRDRLQALFGAGHGVGATAWLFFNSAGYTVHAVDWADEVGMALFRFTLDGDIQPENQSAEDLFL